MLKPAAANSVWVKGGTFKNTTSNYYETGVVVSDFYIGKYGVTQKEWLGIPAIVRCSPSTEVR